MNIIKKILGRINVPLVIFLLLVGGLLVIANIKSEPVKKAKETVNKTVNNVSKTLNNAAQSDSDSLE